MQIIYFRPAGEVAGAELFGTGRVEQHIKFFDRTVQSAGRADKQQSFTPGCRLAGNWLTFYTNFQFFVLNTYVVLLSSIKIFCFQGN